MKHSLYDDTGYWLRRLSDKVHKAFEEKVAANGVTLPEWRILIALYNRDATSGSELARFISVDKALISRTAFSLEKKGLLKRQEGEDRRSELFTLTKEGIQMAISLAIAAETNEKEFFGVLSDEEHLTLKKILFQLLKAQKVDLPEINQ